MLTKICKNLFSNYDLAVIGGGPGGIMELLGYVAAIKAAQLGLKTACIQKRGALGGTCLNVGCIPSKALLNISHKYDQANKHFKDFGLEVQKINVNWETTLKKKTSIVSGLTKGIQGLFKKNKVDYLKGLVHRCSQQIIRLVENDGKSQSISAKNIIIATGSQPTSFPGLPFDQKIVVSSTGALEIPKIPKSMIVVGGGVIGLQLGSVYSRLGTQVTVIQYFDQICPFLDTEIANQFSKILIKQGIKMMTGHKVLSGNNKGSSGQLTIQPVKGGSQQTMSANHILISTGRKPYTENLGAAEIGVKLDKHGRVQIGQHFKTSVGNIFAIGDVVAGPMLAHKACKLNQSEQQGIACVQMIAGKGGHVNYNAIPSVIYTHPQVASVGHTQQQLKQKQIEYSKGSFPFMANSRAKTNDDYDGIIKILSDKKTDKILGVHILGPNAGQMIAQAVLGIQYGASSQDLGRTCHAHPTLSQALKQACMATYGKPIHF